MTVKMHVLKNNSKENQSYIYTCISIIFLNGNSQSGILVYQAPVPELKLTNRKASRESDIWSLSCTQ